MCENLDDFRDMLNNEDIGIGEFVSNNYDNLIEMFETNSAEFEINGSKFVIAISIERVK